MQDKELKQTIREIQAALEVIDLIRERLVLQKAELGNESAEEALDETLTYVSAMQTEYRRREKALHPHHQSFLFFLTEQEVIPIERDCYVELVEGKAVTEDFAGKTLRLADWYVRLHNDKPEKLVNESYRWLVFDEFGRPDLHTSSRIAGSPLPSKKEWSAIHQQLYEIS